MRRIRRSILAATVLSLATWGVSRADNFPVEELSIEQLQTTNGRQASQHGVYLGKDPIGSLSESAAGGEIASHLNGVFYVAVVAGHVAGNLISHRQIERSRFRIAGAHLQRDRKRAQRHCRFVQPAQHAFRQSASSCLRYDGKQIQMSAGIAEMHDGKAE